MMILKLTRLQKKTTKKTQKNNTIKTKTKQSQAKPRCRSMTCSVAELKQLK
jgi:hypothetical protein